MKSNLIEKNYYLITRPDTKLSVVNHKDRAFYLMGKFQHGYSVHTGATINGDPYWEINEKNILQIADLILEEEVQKSLPKPKPPKKKGFFKRWLDERDLRW